MVSSLFDARKKRCTRKFQGFNVVQVVVMLRLYEMQVWIQIKGVQGFLKVVKASSIFQFEVCYIISQFAMACVNFVCS